MSSLRFSTGLPIFGLNQAIRFRSSDCSPPTHRRLKGTFSAPKSIRKKRVAHDSLLRISDEVRHALNTNQAVVALETTIYTHGFPYPDNVALALDLESIVRRHGGIPATIGIIDGVARIGMSTEELRLITASAGKPGTMKVSRRDLPYIFGLGVAGRKLNGGTTVAGTMFLAQKAGIRVFGTGGLGGVHRGGQDSMDISADLTELGRTPVAVISSGCKSFLDIPRTLEYLETQGTGVFTFADGRTGDIDFPSFYTRDSGIKSPMVIQNEHEAAAMISIQTLFPRSSGLLFANPIPEEFSIPKDDINSAIDQAVLDAAEQGFQGHANTPFILSRIKELTKGNSLPANRALIESNVAMATRVAVELAKLEQGMPRVLDDEVPHSVDKHIDFAAPNRRIGSSSPDPSSHTHTSRRETLASHKRLQISTRPEIDAVTSPASEVQPENLDVIVYGSVAMDLSCNYTPAPNVSGSNITERKNSTSPELHTSNIATINPSVGGVGHNVALAAQLAGGGNVSVRLYSVVADDLAGNAILAALHDEGMQTVGITKLPSRNPDDESITRTAQYIATNDTKQNLVMAMADMAIFRSSSSIVEPEMNSHVGKWMIIDANWEPGRIRGLMASGNGAKVAFEPVSVAKSAQFFQPEYPDRVGSGRFITGVDIFPNNIVDLATPNQYELAAMNTAAKENGFFDSDEWWRIIDAFGIPSTGARDRFVALTSNKLVDEGIPFQTIRLLPFIPMILTKLGADGVLMTKLLSPGDSWLTDPAAAPYILSRASNGSTEVGGVYMRLFPAAEKVDDAVSVNGVGDTFLGVLMAGLAKGLEVDERLIHVAQRGAVMTLRSIQAVSPELGQLNKLLDTIRAENYGSKVNTTKVQV